MSYLAGEFPGDGTSLGRLVQMVKESYELNIISSISRGLRSCDWFSPQVGWYLEVPFVDSQNTCESPPCQTFLRGCGLEETKTFVTVGEETGLKQSRGKVEGNRDI